TKQCETVAHQIGRHKVETCGAQVVGNGGGWWRSGPETGATKQGLQRQGATEQQQQVEAGGFGKQETHSQWELVTDGRRFEESVRREEGAEKIQLDPVGGAGILVGWVPGDDGIEQIER